MCNGQHPGHFSKNISATPQQASIFRNPFFRQVVQADFVYMGCLYNFWGRFVYRETISERRTFHFIADEKGAERGVRRNVNRYVRKISDNYTTG